MKISNKILIGILVTVITLISIILLLVIFIMVSFNNEISNYKQDNYLQEDNNTIIASGKDGYIYKINDNVLFYTFNDKIEIMKTDLINNNNYSELIANSKTIFSFYNPTESYYLTNNEKFYIRNRNINKFIDLQTFEVKDCIGRIDGNWVAFQET